MKNFYYILGTPSNCSVAEITEAYHKLAFKFAPGTGNYDPFFETHYREICEAYEILSDPIKRRKYDAALKKSHQRQVYHFKTSYVNIAATLALVSLAVIFGLYVLRAMQVPNAVKVAKAPQLVALPQLKHHKKKHFARIKPAIKRALPVPVLPRVAATSQQITAVPITKAAVKSTPAIPVVTSAQPKADSTYTTYLKSSLGSMVYLHQQADYMSAVVAVLPSHSKLKVLQKGQNFYKVAFNDQTGYVPKWTITTP